MNQPTTDSEQPHLAAIQASVSAGFRFANLADQGQRGELIAIYAERWHAGVVDTYAVMDETEAWGARFRAEDYREGGDNPLWHIAGTTAEVITQLLGLPQPGSPGAPLRAFRTPSELWLPRAGMA